MILLLEDCYLFWVVRPQLEVMYEYPIILYCVKSTRMKRIVLRWWVWEGILSLPDALQHEKDMFLPQGPYVKLSENEKNCKLL